MKSPTHLPDIIAGPIMRRVTQNRLVLWLAASRELDMELQLFKQGNDKSIFAGKVHDFSPPPVQIGSHCFIYLIDYVPATPLPVEEVLEYDLLIDNGDERVNLATSIPNLLYPGQSRPVFTVKLTLNHFLHGSCRKPHYQSEDALLQAEKELSTSLDIPEKRPAFLIMTGDQIYADDVAGPMLVAIHQVSQLLGLYDEQISGATINDSEELLQSPLCYYNRESLLPQTKETKTLRDKFFGGVRKPIFTAASAHNHLVTLAEVEAMYLLVWSPVLWQYVDFDAVTITGNNSALYMRERKEVANFSLGLAKVRRLLAHLPTYMIFDDHDVTDDWNLTRGWEEVAYGHPFSRRIIGNALIAYFLFQGWGNAPQKFDDTFLEQIHSCFKDPGAEKQDQLIDYLLDFEEWKYTLPTNPKTVVLDTRTGRWWSESSLSKPSGLMDWEGLSEMQQELMNQSAVLLVSPAPIFGVKLIEIIQRVITFLGHPLVVDAENWMAHPGSASAMLNIFRHRKTPKNFVILSGDVHYSFAYDIKLRYRTNSPNIWQITCSGFKNEFPHGLLKKFDYFNRWMYGSSSPLNWFTRRRRMKIKSRKPDHNELRRLYNHSAVGRVRLNEEGEPVEISVIPADGSKEVRFHARN